MKLNTLISEGKITSSPDLDTIKSRVKNTALHLQQIFVSHDWSVKLLPHEDPHIDDETGELHTHWKFNATDDSTENQVCGKIYTSQTVSISFMSGYNPNQNPNYYASITLDLKNADDEVIWGAFKDAYDQEILDALDDKGNEISDCFDRHPHQDIKTLIDEWVNDPGKGTINSKKLSKQLYNNLKDIVKSCRD